MLYFESPLIIYAGGLLFFVLSFGLLWNAVRELRSYSKIGSIIRGVFFLALSIGGLWISLYGVFGKFYGIQIEEGREVHIWYAWPRGSHLLPRQEIRSITVQKFFPNSEDLQNFRIRIYVLSGGVHEGLVPHEKLLEVDQVLRKLDFSSVKELDNEHTEYYLQAQE